MKKQNWSVFDIDVSSLLSILPNPAFRLIVVIAIGLWISYGLVNAISKNNSTSTIVQTRRFTRAEYERMKLGMSVVQVESILGAGTETEQYIERKTFVWKNPNSSTITVIFEDGKLLHKRQSGL
ncbi:MAG: hypothetical protein AAFX80_08555 [Cyanobacteria bacterium J06639_18]